MGVEQKRIAVAEQIDAKLAELGALWAKMDGLAKDSAKLDFRRAMAVHGLPGAYHSDDLPPRPMAFKLKQVAA